MKTIINKNLLQSFICYNTKTSLIISSALLLFTTILCAENLNPINSVLNQSEVPSHYGYLKLNIDADNSTHSTEFYFNSNASRGLDVGYDAEIFNSLPPAFSIYSKLVQNTSATENTAFAVQALGDNDMTNVVVPLGLNASQGQEVTISISQSDVPEYINVYLEDIYNDTFTLLNSTNYSFTVDATITGTGRFYLRFEGDALNTEEQLIEALKIFSDTDNNTIVVEGNLDTNTEFRLYDVNGSLVNYIVLDKGNSSQTMNVTGLSTGVYIVKLTNKKNQERTQKIII